MGSATNKDALRNQVLHKQINKREARVAGVPIKKAV